MSANFVAASTQHLLNSTAPFTAFPYTYALWVNPATNPISGARRCFFGLCASANTTHYSTLEHDNTGGTISWQIRGNGGGTAQPTNVGTPSPGRWDFLVGRFISATNRRLAVLHGDGSVAHGQGTGSANPTVNRIGIGALCGNVITNPFDGHIAELWYTNTDIQPDAAQLQDGMLWQLAYGGPFRIPSIASQVVEYRGFRRVVGSDAEAAGDYYLSRLARTAWVNTNGVTRSPHPPLPYWYRPPPQYANPMPQVM